MLNIGIDATNLGSGGGITHLREILENYDELFFKTKIKKIIVFSSQKVLDQLPTIPVLEKVTFQSLNKGLIQRLIFQLIDFDKEVEKRCDVLLSITGDYMGKYDKLIGVSQNMLLYERDIWKDIKHPVEVLRFWLNFRKQKRCFERAKGIIFLSDYARNYISNQIDVSKSLVTIIHHGISSRFTDVSKIQKDITAYSFKRPFQLLYVSTVHVYKHQWNVVYAVEKLRKKGYPVVLNLVGSVIFSPAGKKLFAAVRKVDPQKEFINYQGHIPYEQIEQFYQKADGIVYASTCENMPNILIESMASNTPIACSKKLPMPEFLKDNGFYFNALDVDSIVNAVEELILHPEQSTVFTRNNLNEIKRYSWEETSKSTFSFIEQVYKANWM